MFKRTATVVGGLVLVSALIGVLSAMMALKGGDVAPLPDDMILVLKLENGIAERPAEAGFSGLFPSAQTDIRMLVETLDRAKDDKRVRGLLVSLRSGNIGLAHIQELRAALRRFQDAGKFAKIYSPSYGDLGSGIGVYYLASAFDEIWMQPVGMLSVTGVRMEMPYGRGTLDKIGVRAEFLKREEYKSAMESFTDTRMSADSRRMLGSIVADLSGRMLADIAADRDMTPQALQAQVDQGLLTGAEALKAGLIDRVDYPDILLSETREKATGKPDTDDPPLVTMQRYSAATKRAAHHPAFLEKRGKVALVYVAGTIMPSGTSEGTAAADRISEAIVGAAEDPDIEALVLRIDSPGGSPTASETIRRAIMRVKEEGKTVVVSMGSLAASGGYWIAADADMIYALPSTLTGSIGVVMGKFEASGLWQKLGLNWEAVDWGRNSGLWSVNGPFSENERKRMNALIDSVYDAFLTRVAEGRKIPKEQVRKVARGRAWTGAQGVQNGLVDSLGGLDDALDHTAEVLGLEDRSKLDIVVLPHPRSSVEVLAEFLGQQAQMAGVLKSSVLTLSRFAPFLGRLSMAENPEDYGVYDADLADFEAGFSY